MSYQCACPVPEGSAARRAERILFWVGIASAVVVAFHVAAVLAFRARGVHPPAILEFPRLELFLALAVLQPISQACGRALL